jgi:acetyl-CoA carboxylase carboxyl transferase subunit beta
MSDLPTPIVAAVVGEGGSGGALALAVADTVLMQAGAIYSVIAPEGAATILYRDADRAAELSAKLKLTASDLRALGIVDVVVAEPPDGAGANPEGAALHLKAGVAAALAQLQRSRSDRLVRARIRRYRNVGRAYARQASRRQLAAGSHEPNGTSRST